MGRILLVAINIPDLEREYRSAHTTIVRGTELILGYELRRVYKICADLLEGLDSRVEGVDDTNECDLQLFLYWPRHMN